MNDPTHQTRADARRWPVGVVQAWWLLAAVVGLWLFWQTSAVWLAAFLAVTLTVTLVGLSEQLARRWPLGYGWSLATVVLGLTAACVGLGLWVGPALVGQFDELSQRVPEAVEGGRQWMEQRPWGQSILNQLEQAKSSYGGQAVMDRVGGLLSSFTTAAAGGLAVLAIALFLAIDPGLYAKGARRLVAQRHDDRARAVMDQVATALRWWVLGRLLSMGVVGVFTGVGLWLIGVPLPWVLGFLAGLLSFVPNLGSLTAMGLGMLLASTVSGELVLWTLGVFVGVQLIESNAITPMIQQYVVSVPPAMLLTFQLVMGLLFGVLGLIVSTPLLVAVMVTVQMLWVRGHLGREVKVLGQGTG